MPATTYTPEQRTECIRLHIEYGPAEAARRTGIPKHTIASWARRAHVHTDAPTLTRAQAAREAAAAVAAQKREELKVQLLDNALDLLGRIDQPTEEYVTTAKDVHRVVYDRAPARDAKALADAVSRLVDKLRLEEGAVTSRAEVTTRDALTVELDQLAAALSARAHAEGAVVGDGPTEAGHTAG